MLTSHSSLSLYCYACDILLYSPKEKVFERRYYIGQDSWLCEKCNTNLNLYESQWEDKAKYTLFYPKLCLVETLREKTVQFTEHRVEVYLEAKCNYCGKWFAPTAISCWRRYQSIEGQIGGECRLYCSDGCKGECSIFNRKKFPKGERPASSREVQPELRKMVFERDEYTCQICGSSEKLQCHHITGVKQNPVESADIDNCTTFCRKCHVAVHKEVGCRPIDLKKC